MMKAGVCPSSRAEWRFWPSENHLKEKEVWLVYYKKPETRVRRLNEALQLLEQNKKPGMR